MLQSLFVWAFVVLLVSVAWYPLCARLFGGLPDKGLSAAIPFGCLLTTLAVWFVGQAPLWSGERAVFWRAGVLLLSSAWGLWLVYQKKSPSVYWEQWLGVFLGIAEAVLSLPFGILSCVLVVAAAAALNYGVQYKLLEEPIRFKKSELLFGGCGILLYLLGFVGFAFIRAHVPDITFNPGASGAEKMGNLMHLTSVLRASWFPPQDAWAAGFTTNYYYGGHLSVAHLATLTGSLPWVAFNLAVCHTVGLILTVSYVLGLVLCKRSSRQMANVSQVLHSSFFALCVGVMGNADVVFQAMDASEFSGKRTLLNTLPVVNGYTLFFERGGQGIDYWQSSRAIHGAESSSLDAGTITEFPFFSALLGDMHPHHLAQPFLILALAFLLLVFLVNPKQNTALHFFMVGVFCSALFFLNSWDCIFLTSFVVVLFLFSVSTKSIFEHLKETGWILVGFVPIVFLFTLYFSKPESAVDLELHGLSSLLHRVGLTFVPSEIRTHPAEFLIHFWPLLVALLLSFRKPAALLWGVPLVLAFAMGNILLFQATFFFVLFYLNRELKIAPLIFMAAAVSIGVEVIAIDDYYSGNYERYNTLFKFYYALWPLCWALFFILLLEAKNLGKSISVLLVSAVGFLYPLLGTASRLQYTETEFTLNGIQWMEDSDEWSGDAEFANWVWTQQFPRTLLVESPSQANAQSYGSDGRLASLSGLPSLVGWSHHEMQWRGWGVYLDDPVTHQLKPIDQFFQERRSLAEEVYRTGDFGLLDSYFGLYDRILIVVSEQERVTHSLSEKPFESDPIWSSEKVSVYEYRR